MQHREHGGDSDAGGQQDDRRLAVGEEERPPRCGHVDQIADLHVGVDVSAGGPVRFPLDADPVVVGAGPVGQRVVADQRGFAGFGVEPQRDRLAGKPFRQLSHRRGRPGTPTARARLSSWTAVTRRGRNPGQDGGGLLAAAVNPVLPDDVAAPPFWSAQTLQGRLPARTECRDAKGAFERVTRDAPEGRAGRRSRRPSPVPAPTLS